MGPSVQIWLKPTSLFIFMAIASIQHGLCSNKSLFSWTANCQKEEGNWPLNTILFSHLQWDYYVYSSVILSKCLLNTCKLLSKIHTDLLKCNVYGWTHNKPVGFVALWVKKWWTVSFPLSKFTAVILQFWFTQSLWSSNKLPTSVLMELCCHLLTAAAARQVFMPACIYLIFISKQY